MTNIQSVLVSFIYLSWIGNTYIWLYLNVPEYDLIYLTKSDYTWIYMKYLDISGCIWIYLIISEYIWIWLDISDYIWIYLDISENTWIYLDVSEYIWIYLNVSECIWIYLNICENTWICPNIPEYTWIYPNIPEYIQIYLNISKYTWAWYILDLGFFYNPMAALLPRSSCCLNFDPDFIVMVSQEALYTWKLSIYFTLVEIVNLLKLTICQHSLFMTIVLLKNKHKCILIYCFWWKTALDNANTKIH